jgi:hypothetical protein
MFNPTKGNIPGGGRNNYLLNLEILKSCITFVQVMKKDIKLKGVLLEIVGTKTTGNTGLQTFDKFIKEDETFIDENDFGFQERGFKHFGKKLKEAKEFYTELYRNEIFVDFIDDLAAIETLVLQYRSLYGIKKNVKLGTLKRTSNGVEKTYILARCPFYNPNTIKTEIKVYLGTTDAESRSITELFQDEKYMLKAYDEVFKAMKTIIEKQEKSHSVGGIKNARTLREHNRVNRLLKERNQKLEEQRNKQGN